MALPMALKGPGKRFHMGFEQAKGEGLQLGDGYAKLFPGPNL